MEKPFDKATFAFVSAKVAEYDARKKPLEDALKEPEGTYGNEEYTEHMSMRLARYQASRDAYYEIMCFMADLPNSN